MKSVFGEMAVAVILGLSSAVVPSAFADAIPASAYVRDGLVAQWDALENAGARSRTNGTRNVAKSLN